jgi:hypothetical protein
MGSVSYNVPDGTTTKQGIHDYLTNDCEAEVIDLGVKGSVGYFVARSRGATFAGVALTYRSAGYHNFGIKLVDESMGPFEADPPARVLATIEREVPEPPNDYAAEWRRKCHALAAKRAEARKVKPGAVIRLTAPLSFSDGVERDTFRFVKGSRFTSVTDGIPVSVTRWRDRDFEVVESAA